LQPTSFLIPTIGTRGDLQPYIALASQLMKAGHDPIVASHPCMAQLVKRYNVKFASIGPDIDIGREAANNPGKCATLDDRVYESDEIFLQDAGRIPRRYQKSC
jgi:UDP:flavonoid glycosyltransferase YjiC (YdhE family)